ncbi:hypothetical protein TNCV_3293391 [Trichonephila clavipes]|nr:hypothetical protein TNCV_3293391 [Trichonephila clavipes]
MGDRSGPAPVNWLVISLFGDIAIWVSAADKGWWVYPLVPCPDAIALYSRCTPDCPVTRSPHSSLNTSRGVISEPDLLTTPEAEILNGFSDQGKPKKLKAAQPSQTYAQAAKSLTVSNSIQTDKNITKIVYPPLKLLQPASSLWRQIVSISIPTVSTSSASTQAHLLPSTSTISESQPTIPIFNTNDPLQLADQEIVKKSRKWLLPKYNETGASFLQISKSNIPTKFATIAVKKFAAPKLPLIPRRKKRPPKTKCKDIEIKMTPYKPKKSTPVQYTSDEEEEINYCILTPSRNGK